jgi:antitoxin (DNA-binding transcriptional repressor) of toxin-antitoxin stability system
MRRSASELRQNASQYIRLEAGEIIEVTGEMCR